jgi:hypothetical protein
MRAPLLASFKYLPKKAGRIEELYPYAAHTLLREGALLILWQMA